MSQKTVDHSRNAEEDMEEERKWKHLNVVE